MKKDTPLLQVEDLHTVFYTDAGVVKAVNGVEFALDLIRRELDGGFISA